MNSSIFFGGSVIAAVIAGALALFAPRCISFMLPAFFAGSFQNRLRLVAMTFVFAAGVATIILPIALGASTARQALTKEQSYEAEQHPRQWLVVNGTIVHLHLHRGWDISVRLRAAPRYDRRGDRDA